ncbi:CaiB/BaiF CoA transferase family protein [Salinibacterium soli]|uniref:CoA transferase n=1 Tax=Antiquaquibacter soli TaxID=3064523 RepID=A0ABT9BKK7_9MICO|nr:CoA transferase [Protaetiibacter sp. WY-16]MDO7881553.1 CoA transferase [Protaetiibacter sp. WY-16]
MSNPIRLLEGIRVVSLEQYIGAPYCTGLLADAGAEVIKVEAPGAGDPRRSYDPLRRDAEGTLSGGFASYNRGKRSVELDLKTDEGRAGLDRLLETADVLVSNLRPGSLPRFGLGRDEVRERFPRLVVCELSGFGQTGPYAAWPAFDSVIQAMSGLSSMLGESPESPPGLAPMATMDLLGGVYAALGILAALVGRQRTGVGVHIDASMYDIGAAFLERPLTLHEFTGDVPTRGRDRFSPVGSFRARDGWVALVIPTDEMWRRCCEAIGRPELATDPRLDTVLKRAERMPDLVTDVLEEWAADLTKEEAARILRDGGQPAGVVQSIAEVRADPHLAARGLFQPVDDPRAVNPDGTTLSLPRLPLLFDGTAPVPGPIPALGADTDDLLGEERS